MIQFPRFPGAIDDELGRVLSAGSRVLVVLAVSRPLGAGFGIVLIPAMSLSGRLDFAGSSLRQLKTFLFVDLLISGLQHSGPSCPGMQISPATPPRLCPCHGDGERHQPTTAAVRIGCCHPHLLAPELRHGGRTHSRHGPPAAKPVSHDSSHF